MTTCHGAWVALVFGLLVATRSARAQDFSAPLPPGPERSPFAMLESGLPAAAATSGLASSRCAWLGAPDLVTRALAGALAVRAMRAAVGLSQTGDPEIGWTAAGVALGGAGAAGGAALRLEGRRDRHPEPAESPLGRGVGAEAGVAAWVAASRALTVWTAAPQVWRRGAAPPLARGLELGARLAGGGCALWLCHRAPPHAADADPEHEAGLLLGLGASAAWARARDRPLRGGIGVSLARRPLIVAAEIESHPVLGETTRVSLGLEVGR